MITRTKTPQLHLLPILNLLRIAVSPLHRHLAVRIRIHQYIEGTITLQLRQESNGCRDLSEDGLDLGLDFCFGFFYGGRGIASNEERC
jgi:hypothetical protein